MIRLKVKELEHAGAAARAGVRVGDYLDAYDSIDLNSTDTLIETVAKAEGDAHSLYIFRKNEFITLTCAPGRLGVTVEAVDIERERDSGLLDKYREEKRAELKRALDSVVLTTAGNIDGYTAEVVDIITSECVFGMSMFRDFFTAMTDAFGGRSGTTQKLLSDARKTCLNELRREAADLGANGVIAVKLDYSEFSGAGKSMLFLVASGTAVKLNKVER